MKINDEGDGERNLFNGVIWELMNYSQVEEKVGSPNSLFQ